MTHAVEERAPYRVVQWATGNIGTHTLRGIIEHPRMALVGLYVHSAGKEGRDAGEICGLGRETGVRATRKIDDIIAARPDCVLYMPAVMDLDEVCRLLASGANIVTSVVELHHPPSLAPDVRERVEAACRQGRTSIHSTGSSPGFISEAVPIVLASLARRVDLITIDEFADMSSRNSPEMIFDLMGFGRPPQAVDERRVGHIRHAFGQSLRQLGDALRMPIDEVEAGGEFALAGRRTEIAAGVLEPGTVGAMRFSVEARRGGRAVMRFRANWYCTTDLDPAWELRPTGWRVLMEGDTPMDVGISFPIPPERYPLVSPGFTGNRVLNAVPAVCAAEPGIRTTADLPQVIADLG